MASFTTFLTNDLNINSPLGSALDSSGNLFVANSGNNTITKISTTGSATQFAVTSVSLNKPRGLAFDNSNTNLYVANYGTNSILKIILSSGVASTFSNSTSVAKCSGLAFDSSGNLYVSTATSNTIVKISSSGTVTNFSSSSLLSSPFGLTFDSLGNLYVTNSTNTSVIKITSTGTTTSFITSSLINNPSYIACDNNNTLYIANYGNNNILAITHLAVISIFSENSLIDKPTGISINSTRYLFVINNTGTNNVIKSSNPACFNHDTKILCLNSLTLNNDYIAIQNLKCGQYVKIYSENNDYKKIIYIGQKTMINNNTMLGSLFIKKKNNANNLLEDLIVTGGHSTLVNILSDEQKENELKYRNITKIYDKFLLLCCNNSDFKQIINNNEYTYYHIVLENIDKDKNYGIWANNVLTESMSENSFIKHDFNLLK